MRWLREPSKRSLDVTSPHVRGDARDGSNIKLSTAGQIRAGRIFVIAATDPAERPAIRMADAPERTHGHLYPNARFISF